MISQNTGAIWKLAAFGWRNQGQCHAAETPEDSAMHLPRQAKR
ncbi:hypothetical protein RE6C_05354 [Rhodopirellula europaea 6C]|uniref:Uncharacterized protein n=1 Tax=Rhodopirellula europaea 6C TaxID=1263867 RepID=M2A3T1_9BACT|nr:hypothetical protein RE6C_05354 [Rhodopirellula europaea 6C]